MGLGVRRGRRALPLTLPVPAPWLPIALQLSQCCTVWLSRVSALPRGNLDLPVSFISAVGR